MLLANSANIGSVYSEKEKQYQYSNAFGSFLHLQCSLNVGKP